MKLISLSANVATFHTIKFNPAGISLISAHRRTHQTNRTYNSVGKSLAIYLIHFCLGAKATPDFKEKLPGWGFRLDFMFNDGTQHYSYRTTENENIIIFDDQEMKVKAFNKMMGEKVFGLKEDDKFLSFRSLIARFIREGKSGYTTFNQFKAKEQSPTDEINTAYLLGLDINLILRKVALKEEDDFLKQQEANLSKDPVMHSLLLGSERIEDIELRLIDIRQQIDKLQQDIREFVIAEDYGEIKQQADEISRSLHAWRNTVTKCRISLENISKSLERKPDIKKQNLVNFFEEANISLGDMVIKKLEEVEAFNEQLLNDRSRILLKQQEEYTRQLKEAELKIKELEAEENEKLQYLNSHGALGDYTKLTELLSDLKAKKEKMEQYKNLQKDYKKRREEIQLSSADENLGTQKYLDSIEDLIHHHMEFFHDLVKSFYSDKRAGLQVLNNKGFNKQRYNIEARISDDSGDGVNETKIYCFDWTLLSARQNNSIEFLVHDNRILSETDPRQIATMFRNADSICQANGFQYILTINECSLDLLRQEMSDEEYKRLVQDTEVLELNDASDNGKLLGIHVDLKYE